MNIFRTFKRSVHMPESKYKTEHIPIETILPQKGERMRYPLQQHIGTPCTPLVEAGDRVFMGQKIADSNAPMSVPVHSSVSGKVLGFTETMIPTGDMVTAIIVENDGEFEPHRFTKNLSPRNTDWDEDEIRRLKPEQIRSALREGGIVDLGGTGFPTFIALTPPADKRIDYLILNAVECEPYVHNDHRVMMEKHDRLIRGFRIMLGLFPGSKGIIAIENSKMNVIKLLQDICSKEKFMTLRTLKPKYSQGFEKQVIYACTGREVPSGKLAADMGCIAVNPGTVVAAEECVCRGIPLMQRVITICGGAVRKPGNYRGSIGMSYASLVDAAGGLNSEPAKIIAGGPMTGVALPCLDVPVVKVSSAIICFTEKETAVHVEKDCIRCGKCVDHCPMGLMPLELNKNALKNDDAAFIKNNGMECIECGSCSYICPAKRHLTQSIKSTKRRL